jgi:hypothetical protein
VITLDCDIGVPPEASNKRSRGHGEALHKGAGHTESRAAFLDPIRSRVEVVVSEVGRTPRERMPKFDEAQVSGSPVIATALAALGPLADIMSGRDVRCAPGVPVLTVNPMRLAYSRESGDASPHGRHAQTDRVGSYQVVPIKGFALGGILALRHRCAAKKIAEAARFQQFRSSGFCQPLSDGAARLRPVAL